MEPYEDQGHGQDAGQTEKAEEGQEEDEDHMKEQAERPSPSF
jgi:hypothetical protein